LKSLIQNTIKIALLAALFSLCLLAQTDSTLSNDTTSTPAFVMQKSPWGAVGRSALLPGLGQIYNESYWKAPVIWGIMGWFTYVWIDNNNKYNDYSELYVQNPGNDDYKRYRDFYHDQRDEFAIYFVLTYVLNLVDAYVDAHMFDFSVEENVYTGSKMLNVQFRF